MPKWRRHSVEFKKQAVDKMRTCDNIEALARKLKIQKKLLYTWKWQLEGRPEARRANLQETAEQRTERKLREENQRLKVALGDKSLELDFFKGALRRIKDGQPNNTGSGASASTPKYRRGHSGKAN
jgi:transposase-like protein